MTRGSPARWLTALSIAAVVVVNAAGLWGIAVARRTAQEESVRLFRLETQARARRIESVLLEARADLAFLAGSSAVARLEGLGRPGERWEEEWRQLAAEAVVVFLRAHPEVAHLTVKSGKGYALVRTGRRGGLPVLWSASEDVAAAGGGPYAEPRAPEKYIIAELAFEGSGPDVVRLVAEIDGAALLSRGLAAGGQEPRCTLRDGAGVILGDSGAADAPHDPQALSALAPVQADDWSRPSPWSLTCTSARAPDAPLAPVARRYRLTLALNVGAMFLAVILGSFAIQQTRRHERLLAQANEERRVRELERQLFHSERLATVGRLAAGMAHEINNPLEGMSNYLSLARDELARGQTDRLARRLDGVREGMDRIAGIVRQVLAHADPATAPATPVDVGPLVHQTADFIGTRRELANVTLSVDVPETPLVVQGNAVTLGQVLLNIVLNACEAQPEGGEVKVAARAEPGAIVIEVADRGRGIAPEDLTRIFEPFYSTKQSTGLGLAICHTIVRQHRGELTAENRPDGGALFRIRLPAA